MQTAVSDAEQDAEADADAAGDAAEDAVGDTVGDATGDAVGDTVRFSADISGVRDLSILWLHASGSAAGWAFCRKLFQQGRTAAAAQNFNVSGFA